MEIAVIGLGRMGMNMAKRLLQGEHEVVAFNRTPSKTDQLAKEGAIGAYSIPEVVDKLSFPRIIWIILPAGSTVDEHINKLNAILSPGDIVIDGGNTYYKDDIRRGDQLAEKGIKFMDTGVSGGIWGLEKGWPKSEPKSLSGLKMSPILCFAGHWGNTSMPIDLF
jgi:6-phosphogluconate dehydrogenase